MAAVDKNFCERLACNMELFIEHMDQNVIIEGLTPEDRAMCRKKIKKAIKKLKKGDYKGIINVQRYHEMKERGLL